MTILPIPDKPYPDWSRFLKAVWMHGSMLTNMDPNRIDTAINRACGSIKGSLTKRNESRQIRPSSFLGCGRQAYFMLQDETPADMPDNIGTTFAVGHLLHEVSYAAVQSALPECFIAQVETAVDLPAWWPKGHPKFAESGTADLVLSLADPQEWEQRNKALGDFGAAAQYINGVVLESQPKILVDFKTMGGFTVRKHNKTVFGEDPDAFGYMAQLAVYAESLGIIDSGAVLAGINRDSLTQPLAPRYIEPRILKDELKRVKIAVEMALEGSDPGEEFLIRHDTDAYFQCGRGGKPGYCAFRDACRANPSGNY